MFIWLYQRWQRYIVKPIFVCHVMIYGFVYNAVPQIRRIATLFCLFVFLNGLTSYPFMRFWVFKMDLRSQISLTTLGFEKKFLLASQHFKLLNSFERSNRRVWNEALVTWVRLPRDETWRTANEFAINHTEYFIQFACRRDNNCLFSKKHAADNCICTWWNRRT